ncbi:maltodextrin glucosidase [Vibrio sp. D404a]|uniref:maltodextrin glucosidase n=1 Tax=unclassified Vibrio TaxID=2614977 RepID=UPI002552A0C0|nr:MULTISPECIES: maltodextrin glucosidase [unclassified Vibrio]MDK9736662.1 maltodextrin glucosidase [Vibrio sp. D404a]MDK9796971.1 maltodextrin glucosidase [Vibrio sp. D449a]
MRPYLYHAQTSDFVDLERGFLTLKLHTESDDWNKVQLRHEPDNEEYLVDMSLVGRQGRLFIWEARIPLNTDQPITHYTFKLLSETGQFWLDAQGIHLRMPSRSHHFKFNAEHQPPSWVAKQVFYQIFPERFCNGKPEISVQPGEYRLKEDTLDVVVKEWGAAVEGHNGTGAAEFFGGDLVGVHSKLDYLQQLGVTALYLNPIFQSPSNHKYDTTDYYNVDPHFGTNQEFAALSDDLHSRGMKVVLDAVFNHTSVEHPWFDKLGRGDTGAFGQPQSEFHDYYFFHNDEATQYVGWKGINSLPVLNFSNESVRDYIYQAEDSVIKHWLKAPYGIDGWRFDVIHMLGEGEGAYNNAHYVREFRDAAKSENPEAYILGEHFFEATSWLQGDQEDGSMNYYGFAHPVRALLAKQDIAYDPIDINVHDFSNWLSEARAKVPWLNQLSQLNQLDSHDTARFISLLNGDTAKQEIALALLMTYVGTPCLYYGTEVGLEGGQDPDNRRCFPWGEEQTSSWFEYTQALIKLRQDRTSLQTGAYQELYCDDEVLVYVRSLGQEHTLVAINLAQTPSEVVIPVWKLGLESGEISEVLAGGDALSIDKGQLRLSLKSMSAQLYIN